MRRFRRRPNGRNHMSRSTQPRMGTNQFVNGQSRNNFRPSMSVEKAFEKYSSLAKEAMSAGDKTLSENYLQHADHFARILQSREPASETNLNPSITEETSSDKSKKSEIK